MLTLEEIENISLRRSGLGGGYKTDDVDDFIDKVIEKVRSLEKANSELESRIAEQDKALQEYKKKEDSVQAALVSAQITAKQIAMEATQKSDEKLTESTEKAEKLVNDAKAEAERLVSEAQERADRINSETDSKVEELMNKALRESSALIKENNDIIEEQKKSVLRLIGEAHKFRNTLLKAYKEHLSLINDIAKGQDLKTRKQELDEEYPLKEGNKPVELKSDESSVKEEPAAETVEEEKTETVEEKTAAEEKTEETKAEEESSEKEIDVSSGEKPVESENNDVSEVVFFNDSNAKDNGQSVSSENKPEVLPDEFKPSVLKFEDSDDTNTENTLVFNKVVADKSNNGSSSNNNNRKKHGKKRK